MSKSSSLLGAVLLPLFLVACGSSSDSGTSVSDTNGDAQQNPATPGATDDVDVTDIEVTDVETTDIEISLADDSAAFGLSERAPLADLNLPIEGELLGDFELVNAYPNLTFLEALFVDDVPGENRLVVVEQQGRVQVFVDNPATTEATEILDISSRVAFTGEQGLLGLAFDPRFIENRYVYLSYTEADTNASMVTRVTWDPASDRLDTSQEQVILRVDQPFRNHNGGMIAFGPDNYLYVALGDGGDGGDPQNHGQDRSTLLASLLRIDVNPQNTSEPYGIPASNPFVGETGTRPEIYAYGLRNPWRFSFDRATGDLWLGDVGQGGFEEINRIESGRNYGWRVFEANEENNPFPSRLPDSAYTFPVHAYSHDIGQSVIGGYVYRGAVQSLNGRYIYSDFLNGTVTALSLAGDTVTGVEEIGTIDGPTSFGETSSGELLVVSRYRGLFKFIESSASSAFPTTLSETGVFSDLSSLTPSSGLIEYSPSHPFWSDNAIKRRWIGIPDDANIAFTDNDWTFPIGTVAVKHFEMELVENSPNSRRRLETRVMYNTLQGWQGFSYRWNNAETEAVQVRELQSEQLSVQLNNGDTRVQRYDYPSPADCRSCHTEAATFLLGLETGQQNSNFSYAGVVDNQLRSFNNIGLFNSDIGNVDQYRVIPELTDNSASVEARARAYLDVNCSSCHQPGATAPTNLDLRLEVSNAAMNAIDATPELESFGIQNSRVIAPGDKERSVLWHRMGTLEGGRMPPLSSHVVDETGLNVIGDWIDSM